MLDTLPQWLLYWMLRGHFVSVNEVPLFVHGCLVVDYPLNLDFFRFFWGVTLIFLDYSACVTHRLTEYVHKLPISALRRGIYQNSEPWLMASSTCLRMSSVYRWTIGRVNRASGATFIAQTDQLSFVPNFVVRRANEVWFNLSILVVFKINPDTKKLQFSWQNVKAC